MRYTICVNMPGCLPEQEPYEVDDLRAARAAAHEEIERAFPEDEYPWPLMEGGQLPEPGSPQSRFHDLHSDVDDLGERGGVVGPLPSGYVIDVRPFEPDYGDISEDQSPDEIAEQVEEADERARLAAASSGNAGCDRCGTYDREPGSRLCKHCQADAPAEES